MTFWKRVLCGFVLMLFPGAGFADGTVPLCRWRSAVERIYHETRLGSKQAFEDEFSSEVIQRLVNADLHKEAVLKNCFGVEVTAQMIAEETQRINQSSQAPETLAKIKAVLGADGMGFAEVVVKPIIVERLLRQKYYQDKTIHAAERASATDKRQRLQAGESVEGIAELLWLLGQPPEEVSKAPNKMAGSQIQSSGGAYTNEATVQVAEVIGGPEADDATKKDLYFDEFTPELCEVLKTQLRKTRDVSSVIETPEGFSIYRARELTAKQWKVETVFIPRKSYDTWLATQR